MSSIPRLRRVLRGMERLQRYELEFAGWDEAPVERREAWEAQRRSRKPRAVLGDFQQLRGRDAQKLRAFDFGQGFGLAAFQDGLQGLDIVAGDPARG